VKTSIQFSIYVSFN